MGSVIYSPIMDEGCKQGFYIAVIILMLYVIWQRSSKSGCGCSEYMTGGGCGCQEGMRGMKSPAGYRAGIYPRHDQRLIWGLRPPPWKTPYWKKAEGNPYLYPNANLPKMQW